MRKRHRRSLLNRCNSQFGIDTCLPRSTLPLLSLSLIRAAEKVAAEKKKAIGALLDGIMENRGNKLLVSESRSYPNLLKRCKTIGVKDHISGLANELLVDVLTRLSLKEAAKTSTLSKRWRYLWRSRPTLDLESKRMGMYPATFQQTVNTILGQYDSPKLHELRIAGAVPGNSVESVDDWMSFAINKGASKLEFAVFFLPSPHRSSKYCVPLHSFGANRVDSLRHLSLKSVILSSHVFDTILTRCCHLESFILMSSNGPVYAKNTTPHQNLKLINFYLCDDLEMVELWAPNLLSFGYHGRQRSICIKDCKQLLTLRLTSGISSDSHPSLVCPKVFFGQFSSYLPKLESLIIGVHLFKNRNEFAELHLLSSLKQLALDVAISSLIPLVYELAASILRVAPYVQLLEINLPPGIDVHLNYQRDALELGSMSLHQNLVELKFTGFRGASHFRLSSHLAWKEDEAEVCEEFARQLRQRLPANARLFFHDI